MPTSLGLLRLVSPLRRWPGPMRGVPLMITTVLTRLARHNSGDHGVDPAGRKALTSCRVLRDEPGPDRGDRPAEVAVTDGPGQQVCQGEQIQRLALLAPARRQLAAAAAEALGEPGGKGGRALAGEPQHVADVMQRAAA